MDVARPATAAALFFFAGWVAGSFQHLLYREPQFRRDFARGRKAVAIRGGAGLASAFTAAVAFRGGHYSLGPALLTAVFALALIVLSSTDFERRRIPDRLTYPAVLAALVFCWAWPDRGPGSILAGLAFAAAVGVAVFILGVLLGGAVGGLGLGDVKLMILIGALLGWPATMYALFVGMILGGIPAVFLLATRRSRTFSYGPYLAAGAIIGLLWPARYL